MANKKICCSSDKKEKTGLKAGLVYGLLPHSFCLAFMVFSVVGATVATTFFRRLLLVPYFFQTLIGLSLVFATISGLIYLRKNDLLSLEGIKSKKKYLVTLYGTTIGVNLLFFMIIFPLLTNIRPIGAKSPAALSGEANLSSITFKVSIPCPGHAPLISSELKKIEGVSGVNFKLPNVFEVFYNPKVVSPGKLLSLEIFKSFKAVIL